MDYQVSWSPEAVEDLESICKYIERDSEFYAKAVVSKVLETAKKIPNFPKLGRVVPELCNERFREFFVYSYRLIYEITEKDINIIAIIHGKRLIENLDDRF